MEAQRPYADCRVLRVGDIGRIQQVAANDEPDTNACVGFTQVRKITVVPDTSGHYTAQCRECVRMRVR